MYKIIADSSCDIKEFPNVNFETVPLTISTDEKSFVDDINLDTNEMLEYLAAYKGRSYTACPSTESWIKAFDDADELYVVALTSGLSGTYNSACIAADIYKETHPQAKIYCVDTLSTSGEMRLIVEKIANLKTEGKTFEEIKEIIPQYKKKTRLFFAFTSLHNLSQNGRVNKVLASAINALGISILGTASDEGTIDPITKCRGEKRVIKQLVEASEKAGYKGGKINISYMSNEELATNIAEAYKVKFPDADVKTYPARGLCCYYGESGGIIIGCEC